MKYDVTKSISVTDGSKYHQRINQTLNVYETHISRWKLKPNKKCKLDVIVHRNPEKKMKNYNKQFVRCKSQTRKSQWKNEKILPTQMEQTIPWNKLVREYFNEAEWAKGCKYQQWIKIYHDKYNRIRVLFKHSNAKRLNYIITSVGMSMIEFRTLGTLEPVGIGLFEFMDMHLWHCLGEIIK
jgi:hypothetical protein